MVPERAQAALWGGSPTRLGLQGGGGAAEARAAGSTVWVLSPSPQIYGWVTESLLVTGCAMHHLPGAPASARASPPTPTPSAAGALPKVRAVCIRRHSLWAPQAQAQSPVPSARWATASAPEALRGARRGWEPVADAGQEQERPKKTPVARPLWNSRCRAPSLPV